MINMQDINMDVVEKIRAFIAESPRYKLIDFIRTHVTTDIDESRVDPKIKCPFHGTERTPSFLISLQLNKYHCFGCDTSGDYVKFVSEFNRINENLNIGYFRTMDNILKGDPEMIVTVGSNTIFKSKEMSIEEIKTIKPRFFKPSSERRISTLLELTDWMKANQRVSMSDIKTAVVSAQRNLMPEDIKSVILGELRSDIVIPDMSDVTFEGLLDGFEVTMGDS